MAKAAERYRETYNGVKIDLTPTKKALQAKVSARKAEIDAGTKPMLRDVTVSEWADIYLENYYRQTVSDYTYNCTMGYFNKYIKPQLGKKLVRELLPLDVQTFIMQYKAMSKSHISHLLSALNGMMARAMLDNIRPDNPAAAVIPPKGTDGSHRDITDEERRVFLLACDKHRDGLMFRMMLSLGLSPQEVRAIEAEDVDINVRIISITGAIVTNRTAKGKTKTEYRVRDLPILDDIYDDLAAALPQSGPVFRTPLIKNRTGKILRGGHVIGRKAIYDRWDQLREIMQQIMNAEATKLGKKPTILADDFDMYCLRHTFATDAISADIPLYKLKNLMGHKDTRMVEKRYGHQRVEHLTDDAEQLNAYRKRLAGTNTETKIIKLKKVAK